ncbi:MAG: hypothetical protein IPF92_31065 [Myxococcales bacterium]|nr:hypothetical protein [Myxococcales bacterium]HQY61781.1 hypothetical protein [Polyangiaceae bacterium]
MVSSRGLGVALALALAALGCSRAAPDATPDGALRLFLERMEVATDDPRAMSEAYELLGKNAKHNLDERAARASLVEGKRVSPREMLAMGRFGLRFRPKNMTARVEGDSAVVSVTGSDPQERADIACVREGAAWRIEPELPPLSIQQRRPDGGR